MSEAIAFSRHGSVSGATKPETEKPETEKSDNQEPGNDIVELLFFAYRDFVSDPDRLLAQYGFGRAHHRVLHFVERQPGLTIAEMLDILGITKQSLNPILKDLVEKGYIVQRTGTVDRRQRLLFPTESGLALSQELTSPQLARIAAALGGCDNATREKIKAFLFAMIDADDREHVARLVWKSGATADGGN